MTGWLAARRFGAGTRGLDLGRNADGEALDGGMRDNRELATIRALLVIMLIGLNQFATYSRRARK